jgi:predicted Zn-dependent protease
MRNDHSVKNLSLFIAVCLLSGCTGTVTAPDVSGSNLSVGKTLSANSSSGSAQELTAADLAVEGAISDESLKAWRQSLTGDVKGAMLRMKALDQRYPNSKTVSFMEGQILDHAGNKKEAVKYYRAAVLGNEFDQIHLFKLAEAERIAGDTTGAISDYRKLTTEAPQFLDARIGLAKVLLKKDSKSKEAIKELEGVLKEDPTNKEAAALLAEKSNPPKK